MVTASKNQKVVWVAPAGHAGKLYATCWHNWSNPRTWSFHIKSRNGNTLVVGAGYNTRQACLRTMNIFKPLLKEIRQKTV